MLIPSLHHFSPSNTTRKLLHKTFVWSDFLCIFKKYQVNCFSSLFYVFIPFPCLVYLLNNHSFGFVWNISYNLSLYKTYTYKHRLHSRKLENKDWRWNNRERKKIIMEIENENEILVLNGITKKKTNACSWIIDTYTKIIHCRLWHLVFEMYVLSSFSPQFQGNSHSIPQ